MGGGGGLTSSPSSSDDEYEMSYGPRGSHEDEVGSGGLGGLVG